MGDYWQARSLGTTGGGGGGAPISYLIKKGLPLVECRGGGGVRLLAGLFFWDHWGRPHFVFAKKEFAFDGMQGGRGGPRGPKRTSLSVIAYVEDVPPLYKQ